MKEYVVINDANLLTHYGLHLLNYSVGAATPDIKLINVPGRPGKLDATLALNGKVNYTTRPITITLHMRDTDYEAFHDKLSGISRLINGVLSKVSFSTDPNWYYKGRFTISYTKTNPVTGQIVLTCREAFPYKLDNTKETGNWAFDPTDFTRDYGCEKTVTDGTVITCKGFEYNGTVTIYTSKTMQVTWNGQTYQLAKGKNTLYEIHFTEGDNELAFTLSGTGKVRIEYERGIQ